MEQLKPCPFCGGAAERWNNHVSHCGDGYTAYRVGCYPCGVYMVACGPWGYAGGSGQHEATKELAAAKAATLWNTRAQ